MRKIKRSFSKLYAQIITTGDVAHFSDRIHISDGTGRKKELTVFLLHVTD